MDGNGKEKDGEREICIVQFTYKKENVLPTKAGMKPGYNNGNYKTKPYSDKIVFVAESERASACLLDIVVTRDY